MVLSILIMKRNYTKGLRKLLLEKFFMGVDNTTEKKHIDTIINRIGKNIQGLKSPITYDENAKEMKINNNVFSMIKAEEDDLNEDQRYFFYNFIPDNNSNYNLSTYVVLGSKNNYREIDVSEVIEYYNLHKHNVN